MPCLLRKAFSSVFRRRHRSENIRSSEESQKIMDKSIESQKVMDTSREIEQSKEVEGSEIARLLFFLYSPHAERRNCLVY